MKRYMRTALVLVSFLPAIAVQNPRLYAQSADGNQRQPTTAQSSAGKKEVNQKSEPRAGENTAKEPSKEAQQAADNAKNTMNALKEAFTAAGIPTNGIEQLVAVIQQLTRSTRADQQSVYLFAKQVNRNLDTLVADGDHVNCKLDCRTFKESVLSKTRRLLESSYVDDLVQNGNLSYQIKLRMPLLVADSLMLADNVGPEAAKAAAAAAAAAATATAAEVAVNKKMQGKTQEKKTQDKEPPDTKPLDPKPSDTKPQGKNPSDTPPDSKIDDGKDVVVQCPKNGETVSATQWQCAAWNRRRDFEHDLDQLSKRYIDSKRFRFGIGLSYSYMPPVSYTFTSVFDYSPYQQTVTSAVKSPTNGLSGSAIFADATYPGLLLSAKIPYFRLDATVSNRQRTSTAVGPVWLNHVDPSADPPTDVLTRDTVTSKLRIYYDLSLKAQLVEALGRLKVRLPTRFEVGVGGGVSGLRAEDNISTEIKKLTKGMTFNDLPPGTIVNTSTDTSFHPVFLNTDLTLKISDEFHVSFEGKWYHDKTSVTKAIYVNGATFSISMVWFPTLF